MKAIRIERPGEITLFEMEKPVPGAGEALIQIEAAGICGSDIGALRGTNGLVSYPRVIGHELVGKILSVPEDYHGNLRPGDRVAADPYLYCGQCYPCSLGRTNCCTELKVLGVHIDGGMAEYFTHPVNMLLKLPSDLDLDAAVMIEPLSIALHGLHRLRLSAQEHIAIWGAGPIGLLAAMAAMHYGGIPIILDPVDARLEVARKLGVVYTINPKKENFIEAINNITGQRGCECVLEASGANEAIRSTLEAVSYAGRIVLTGWPKAETAIPTDLITKKEVDLRGARTSAGELQEAIELISMGKVDVTAILTKLVPLDEAPATLMDIEKNPGKYLKAGVYFNH